MNRVTILIDDELLEKLKTLAKGNSTNVSQMVRRLVLEESKRNEVD